MSLGPAEILVVLVLALIVFGPKRLPEVGRQVGGALRELRRVQETVQTEIRTVLDDTDAPVGRMSSYEPSREPDLGDEHNRLPAPEPGPEGHGNIEDHGNIEGLSGGTFS